MTFILGLSAYEAGRLHAGVIYPGLAVHAFCHQSVDYEALTTSA